MKNQEFRIKNFGEVSLSESAFPFSILYSLFSIHFFTLSAFATHSSPSAFLATNGVVPFNVST